MSSKQAYQLQPTQNIQLSHLQPQQLVNNYHGQKQISTDIASAHQYTSALGNMPAQNGTTYQSISGKSHYCFLVSSIYMRKSYIIRYLRQVTGVDNRCVS